VDDPLPPANELLHSSLPNCVEDVHVVDQIVGSQVGFLSCFDHMRQLKALQLVKIVPDDCKLFRTVGFDVDLLGLFPIAQFLEQVFHLRICHNSAGEQALLVSEGSVRSCGLSDALGAIGVFRHLL
jgi:hypothetical protein